MKFVTGKTAFAAVFGVAALLLLPCSSQAQFMGKAGQITVKLTIPEGVTKMRGLLAFTATGLGPGMASGDDWKQLAKRLSAGMISVGGANEFGDASYPTRCKNGEFKWLLDAIADVAKASGHPEITNAPIAGHGHSHGGDYWNYFNACYPERMALIFCKSSGGVEYSKGSLKTPMVWEIGTNDLKSSNGNFRGVMLAHRALGTQMALVLGPGETHGGFTQGSRAMVIDLIEAYFNLRVPAEVDTSEKPIALFDIDEKGGGYWLGNDYTKEITPYAMSPDKEALEKTSFLPTEELAKKWKAYGAQLPESITIEHGACNKCYKTPAGEPDATPNNAGPPAGSPPADAGAPDPGASPNVDAAAPPPVTTPDPPVTTPPVDAGTTPPGAGSTPPANNPAPTPTTNPSGSGNPPPATNEPATGGCGIAGPPAGAAAWGVGSSLLAFALTAARVRRRRRAAGGICRPIG